MNQGKETMTENRPTVVGSGGDFVTFTIAGQLFGVPVLEVQDVLRPQAVTRIPMAPPEILGSLNLRGRIVTVVDTRHRLGLPKAEGNDQPMSIVVPHGDDLFSLAVDKVGEVLSPNPQSFEPNPPTLDPAWREVATGIYRLKDELLVVIDVARLLRLGGATAHAA
jgi:purine-binding chemotaxis protein CheW